MTDPPTPTLEGQRPAASIGVIAATAAAWVLGMLSYWAQPQLFGALMKDHGLGEEAVGWIFSIENAALALTILAAAGPLARFSRPRGVGRADGVVRRNLRMVDSAPGR